MLPSRGLRPAQFVPLASRQSRVVRCNAPRKFSSVPRIALSTPSCRTRPLHSARWRAGAATNSNIVLTASSVRYGSWYAPWSWGKSSTPSTPMEQAPASDLADHTPHLPAEFVQSIQPVVTSSTPELAPAGIDKAAVVDGVWDAPSVAGQTIEELLARDMPKAEIDPTQLITQAGQLKELGLDYGWGMTTLFQNTIETIYLSSGWGWAGSIVGACVSVRCLLFTLQVFSSDKMAGMAALAPILKPFEEKIAVAKERGDMQQVNMLKMQQAQAMRPHMGGMLSMTGLMVAQGWIGFCAFRCLRAMGTLPVPGMSQDGWIWFTDLTVRDPYFLLPVATTAIMYKVFKSGGETGVQPNVGEQAIMRQKVLTSMAFLIGIVTAFQPSGLQLYFLTTSILGGITGWLLRQNGVRRFLRIRLVPTKESNELYTKVVSGEMTLEQLKTQKLKSRDGKFRYEPAKPTIPTNSRGATTFSGINLKAGTMLPAHFKPPAAQGVNKDRPDRDADFNEGPQGSLRQKMDYYRRNYRLSFLWRRVTNKMEDTVRNAGYGGPKLTKEQARRKKAAEDYEIERRRRFENRK